MANISTLPIWKKGASAADRLEELACLAREHPERFAAFALVYRETTKQGGWVIREHFFEPGNADDAPYMDKEIGLFELGKMRAYERFKGG